MARLLRLTAVAALAAAAALAAPASARLAGDRREAFIPGTERLGYPVEILPQSNRTVFAMEAMNNGRLQVVALGKDGQLWHVFQRADGTWEDWRQLTSLCPSGLDPKRRCNFDGDPAIGRNRDGRLEVFARFKDNLDLWQMHQIDPHNPAKWSKPREGSCVDQDQSTAIWHCLQAGMPAEQNYAHYWIIGSPVFPTSNVAVISDPRDGRLRVFYRNFEGHMYFVEQEEAGNSWQYTEPQILTDDVLFI